MRDSETMAAALTAAETGHLVLSSLHTNDAAQTISRILDIFPAGYQSQMRQSALTCAAGGHLSAARARPSTESIAIPPLRSSWPPSAIRNLIRRGEDHQLRANIETGRSDGMQTMEQSLAELVRSQRISRDTAYSHTSHPEDLRRHLGE